MVEFQKVHDVKLITLNSVRIKKKTLIVPNICVGVCGRAGINLKLQSPLCNEVWRQEHEVGLCGHMSYGHMTPVTCGSLSVWYDLNQTKACVNVA